MTADPSKDPNKLAAHEFLSELRTRISTQPLPYQYGVESRALESLWEVFGQAREIMKKNPGCEDFAKKVTEILNVELRPVTAKWHRAHAEGRLNSRDGADEFRRDLARVQGKLQKFAETLHVMAYDSKYRDNPSPAISDAEIDQCFKPIEFGIAYVGPKKDQIDAINSDESLEVNTRRGNYKIAANGKNAIGMAFSGGGIRSATFCLGVTQVLAEKDLLKEVDFLSTVSGGGYTGSFLTSRLGDAKTNLGDFAAPHGPDTPPVQYVRNRAKFLSPTNMKDAWAMVTGTLAGMLLNWTVPLLLIVVAAIFAVRFWSSLSGLPKVLAFAGVASAVALLIYGISLRGRSAARKIGAWVLGFALAATALVGVFVLLRWGYLALLARVTGPSATTLTFMGIVSAIAAAGPAIVRFLPLLQKTGVRRIVMQVLLVIAGVVVPLLAVLLFYLLVYIGRGASVEVLGTKYGGEYILSALAVLLAVVAFFILDINATSPHRLYRDGLARTFTKQSDNDPRIPLNTMNPHGTAPYHLINTTLNLPSSEAPDLQDRKCTFFVFSKHHCGSLVTDYVPTAQWQMRGEVVDLATAMATSGAAASAHMGLISMPTLTALMTVLNIRMGIWIRRAEANSQARTPGNPFKAPGFFCLIREMLGIKMSEKSNWFNLTDGGHLENLGVYELLRRRCKFIISVDGECDSDFTFGALRTVVRHAQIDFGIRIEPHSREVRPDAKTTFSQTHALLCRIHYPASGSQPAGTGLLLYVKLSVTGNETELILGYRNAHPDFPHQSTADQFFDEEQFEAYRELGVHVAEGLFSETLMSGNGDPTSVEQWFKRLAGNLLEPESV